MGLNSEQSRKLIELLRDYQRLQAEVRALASILRLAEVQGPQVDWVDALKELRQTSEYKSIAEQYEPLFLRVEKAADAKEVETLLSTLPPTQWLH